MVGAGVAKSRWRGAFSPPRPGHVTSRRDRKWPLAAMAELKKLESRLQELERRLYGEGGAGTGAKAKPQCTDAVVKVQVSLGNVAGKRERIKTLYKKIDDLMKYLDPLYMDRIVIPDAMKLELILAEEPFIHSQVTLLESVSKLQPFLESEHIKAVPNYSSKLQSLTQIQIQEQDQCTAVTEDTRKLLDEYNKMTLLLSKQFVQWEEALSKLEAAKQVKPLRD
uniref:Dynactin 3 (p22) n=2 Tax=Callorhinchus milii TaxID=7868 RepID=A0A4W3I4B6_CALMI|eukprot:gi/632958906/ref/XP_007895316.1/ PREDICTED: dynactin subunit 3 [Callorhinchus milii]